MAISYIWIRLDHGLRAMIHVDWDDPASRARLIERVGLYEYNRLHDEQFRSSTIMRPNGYSIRPVVSRFGKLYMVDAGGKATRGFRTIAEAEAYAKTLPPRKGKT